jgi:hypothetical protein
MIEEIALEENEHRFNDALSILQRTLEAGTGVPDVAASVSVHYVY